MRSPDLRAAAGRSGRWRECTLVLLLVLASKQALSMADANQLQWLLWPVAQLLNATGTMDFHPTPSGAWLDAGRGLAIVKACAGGNFLVASWVGWMWCWRDRPCGPASIARAAIAAWLTTLVANAVRILSIAHGQDDLVTVTGLGADDAHRLIGIVVYFGCLAVQMGGGRALSAATAVYVGVTLLLPAARAAVLGGEFPTPTHIMWTAAIPLAVSAAYAAACRWSRDAPPLLSRSASPSASGSLRMHRP